MPLAICAGWAGCVLLAVAGTVKLLRPRPLARAGKAAGLPLGTRSVRLIALAEVATAAWAVLGSGRASYAVAAAFFVGFTAFVLRLRQRAGAGQPCGCFGRDDLTLSPLHPLVTFGYAVALATLAIAPPLPATRLGAAETAVVALLAAGIAYLSYVVLAVLPLAQVRPAGARG